MKGRRKRRRKKKRRREGWTKTLRMETRAGSVFMAVAGSGLDEKNDEREGTGGSNRDRIG